MKNYLDVNVILTFSSPDAYGDTQEFFDLKLPINKKESNAVNFLDKKLFKRIAAKCDKYRRNKQKLIKISTASNWKLFEQVTSKPSLASLGHNCKWYFNDDINQLDSWEKQLKQDYQFGTAIN
jgi:hypothetical protein